LLTDAVAIVFLLSTVVTITGVFLSSVVFAVVVVVTIAIDIASIDYYLWFGCFFSNDRKYLPI